MFFVISINEDGVPGKLFGPQDWDEAVEKVVSLLQAGAEEAIQVTPEIRDEIEMDGTYEYENGGGIYIIQPE